MQILMQHAIFGIALGKTQLAKAILASLGKYFFVGAMHSISLALRRCDPW